MSKPLKVLVVISNLTHGGAERQVVELANRIDSNLVDLHICSLSTHCPLAKHLNSPEKLHILEKKSKYDIALIFRLASFLKNNHFNLVHGFLFDAEIASRFAGRIAGIKVIGSERNSKNNFGKFKTWIYRATSGLMDLCVANSNAGARFSQQAFGIPADRYAVIYNGVDTNRFSPGLSSIDRSTLGIGDSVKVVAMVGSFKRQKNHAFLLAAIKELKARFEQVVFVFVGSPIKEGPEANTGYYEEVQALVDEYGIRDMCKFVDARSDIEEVYRLCDFTVLPSLFEGTPNVVLESLACGVPVIASDVADNRYVLPADVGFIVSLGEVTALQESMYSLLTNESLRQDMSLRARSWVQEKFSLSSMADKFSQIYIS